MDILAVVEKKNVQPGKQKASLLVLLLLLFLSLHTYIYKYIYIPGTYYRLHNITPYLHERNVGFHRPQGGCSAFGVAGEEEVSGGGERQLLDLNGETQQQKQKHNRYTNIQIDFKEQVHLMYQAASKVENQPLNRSNSRLAIRFR